MDIMLDLETLGLTPGCVILSVGAVTFDRKTGELGDTFYEVLDIDEQQGAGLKIDDATVKWWAQQNRVAFDAARANAKPAAEVLKRFFHFYKDQVGTGLWANGANFDVPILEACFTAFRQGSPWHYRHPRDVRTAFDLVGKKIGAYGSENPLAHDALQDAIWQAKETVAAIRELTAA